MQARAVQPSQGVWSVWGDHCSSESIQPCLLCFPLCQGTFPPLRPILVPKKHWMHYVRYILCQTWRCIDNVCWVWYALFEGLTFLTSPTSVLLHFSVRKTQHWTVKIALGTVYLLQYLAAQQLSHTSWKAGNKDKCVPGNQSLQLHVIGHIIFLLCRAGTFQARLTMGATTVLCTTISGVRTVFPHS